jgi:hypothetical protein
VLGNKKRGSISKPGSESPEGARSLNSQQQVTMIIQQDDCGRTSVQQESCCDNTLPHFHLPSGSNPGNRNHRNSIIALIPLENGESALEKLTRSSTWTQMKKNDMGDLDILESLHPLLENNEDTHRSYPVDPGI